MANIKSSKKRAKQSIKRRQINLARKTALKTAIKKVLLAVEKKDKEVAKELLKDAEANLARAKGKGTIHRRAAFRKISRLTKHVNAIA
ncbi:MAG: 30S ribosomal protein S20 [Candidatus Babeliales bacterium]